MGEKIADVDTGFFEILPIQLSVIVKDKRSAYQYLSELSRSACDHRYDIGTECVYRHRNYHSFRVFVLKRALRSYGAYGNAYDIIEHTEL